MYKYYGDALRWIQPYSLVLWNYLFTSIVILVIYCYFIFLYTVLAYACSFINSTQFAPKIEKRYTQPNDVQFLNIRNFTPACDAIAENAHANGLIGDNRINRLIDYSDFLLMTATK